MDFDVEGLANWAKRHFGVELRPDDPRAKGLAGRKAVEEVLMEAALNRIEDRQPRRPRQVRRQATTACRNW